MQYEIARACLVSPTDRQFYGTAIPPMTNGTRPGSGGERVRGRTSVAEPKPFLIYSRQREGPGLRDRAAAARAGGIPVMSSLLGDAERGALFDLTHDCGTRSGERSASWPATSSRVPMRALWQSRCIPKT